MRWRFVIAARLGMTVAQLEATMSLDEFVHWQVFLDEERRAAAAAAARRARGR